MIKFLFLTVSSPFRLGVYENDELKKEYVAEGKASDVLPVMIDEALKDYAPNEIYYTNGPGNHMSLKIAYVCLKSISIVKKIPLYGVTPFAFNGNLPIRAFGNSYFVYETGRISLKVFENIPTVGEPILPSRCDFAAVQGAPEPLFILPAV
ncbi:MAG: tRNA threonylcarbamoyladenosine biosynthesis protein TsaB [Campylobacterales bacterium]